MPLTQTININYQKNFVKLLFIDSMQQFSLYQAYISWQKKVRTYIQKPQLM